MTSGSILKKASGIVVLATSLVVFLLLAPEAFGQTSSPQFLVTWKSLGSYIPSFYEGKALPTYGSKVTASLELLSQGRVLDLRSQTIYWYIDGVLVGNGQQVTFLPDGAPPSLDSLRVDLPYYAGGLDHTIQIPTTQPEAVIYAPYADSQFSSSPLNLTALPYFFNISDPSALYFSWQVNGQTGSNAENPGQVQIVLPPGTQSGTNLAVSLTIENNFDSTQATALETLTYQNQL